MSSQLSKQEIKYWAAFNQISLLGPIRFKKLLAFFSRLSEAWQAGMNELIQAGIEPKVAAEIVSQRIAIDPDLELEKLEKIKARVITILDSNYPKLLKEIYAPPPLLYYFGQFDLNNDFPLAVVGSRKITEYGKLVTQQIVSQLVKSGLTIVSGLALGIDICAHQTAIENGGKTIAVLGSGLDQIYPATNRQIAPKIIDTGGAIITEFPLGMPPLKHNFPQRNRIISGLSLGTLVTEAGEKSGALITAKYALEQNREVFAVPGNITRQSSVGPNNLIKLGANIVIDSNDILETLSLEQIKNFKVAKEIIPENEAEKTILKLLNFEPIHVDKLASYARLDISVVNSTLSIMEMKGLIKNLGNQKYIKAR